MSHKEQIEYCKKIKSKLPEYFKDNRVLDCGSLDVNGNNRHLFQNCEYIGIDVGEGKNVDVVSKIHEYNSDPFDVIISTEALEHDKYYRDSLKNMFNLLKSGGLLLITCASTNRPEHGTKRTKPEDAPLLEWDYYKNLTEEDFREVLDMTLFSEYSFETQRNEQDLNFYGVKV